MPLGSVLSSRDRSAGRHGDGPVSSQQHMNIKEEVSPKAQLIYILDHPQRICTSVGDGLTLMCFHSLYLFIFHKNSLSTFLTVV